MKKFTAQAVKWHDKVNGNTYHSVKVTRHEDGAVVYGQFQYGYGEQYKQTALDEMMKAGWLPSKYGEPCNHGGDHTYLYEREHDYPIIWVETKGTKKECIANGII